LGGRLARAAHQAGRELSELESRRELARFERELARLYQELGEAAYEGWRQAGVISLRSTGMPVRLEAIAALTAQRDAAKRELAQEEVAGPLSADRGEAG